MDLEWLVDKDGDLWHLRPGGLYRCVTQEDNTLTFDALNTLFGPLTEAAWTIRADG